jgi:hypothetical protein
MSPGGCNGTIPDGGSCFMLMQFTPGASGSRSAVIQFTDTIGSQTFTLNGTGSGSVSPVPANLSPFAPVLTDFRKQNELHKTFFAGALR